MDKLVKALKNPRLALFLLVEKLSFLFSDKIYLQLCFYLKMGKKLNLKHPVTFNEKLQWLKLYNRHPKYTQMVDKIEVKKYVAKKIGEQYIIPTLGVWDTPDEINFEMLPNKFVLKCNHNSGVGLCICHNKNKLNISKVKKDLSRGLRQNFYWIAREWPYKNVRRRIIAEKLMVDESGIELKDYKVFCFNGEPTIIEVDYDRFVGHKRNFYDKEWNFLDLEIQYPSDKSHEIPKPNCLEQMLLLSHKLSEGIPHVRTYFYCINDNLYFGELTFFHEAGLGTFRPVEWDKYLGSLISI